MTPSAPALVPAARRSWWDDEIGRLLDTAPTLARGARETVRRVLVSLLDEPGLDQDAFRDVQVVLEALGADPA